MTLNRMIAWAVTSAAVLASGAALRAEPEQGPLGVWIDHTGRGAVEVTDCAGNLCGHLVWFKDPNNSKGCGLQIVGDAVPMGAGVWDNGWIYDPEKKSKYDVEITTLPDGKLRVKGYAGAKFLSKTMLWTRAPEGLVRCSATPAAAAVAPAPAKERGTVDPGKQPAAAKKSDDPAAEKPATKVQRGTLKPEQAQKRSDPADAEPKSPDRAKTARVEPEPAVGEPEKRERRRAAGDKDCTLVVPYVTLKFPCKD